ncbi:hypothetical protein ABQE48_13080 [Mycolicibacterium thermoresistibile]
MGKSTQLFFWGAAFFWGGIALGGMGVGAAPFFSIIGMILGVIWLFSLFSGGGGGGSVAHGGGTSLAHQAAIDAERAAAQRAAADEAHRAELDRRAAERQEALRRLTTQRGADDDGWD